LAAKVQQLFELSNEISKIITTFAPKIIKNEEITEHFIISNHRFAPIFITASPQKSLSAKASANSPNGIRAIIALLPQNCNSRLINPISTSLASELRMFNYDNIYHKHLKVL